MRPPDQVARELAGEWLGKADVDLSAASVLLSVGELYEVVAFHAQQAAEKALKALLVARQVEFTKTHDISVWR
jgi:HEPN domain-containing protein